MQCLFPQRPPGKRLDTRGGRFILQEGRHGALILPDAHSTDEAVGALDREYRAELLMVASHHVGDLRQQTTSGGLALVLRKDFLQRFEEAWFEELVQGRVLLVTLRGKAGCMEVAAVSGSTGDAGYSERADSWEALKRW